MNYQKREMNQSCSNCEVLSRTLFKVNVEKYDKPEPGLRCSGRDLKPVPPAQKLEADCLRHNSLGAGKTLMNASFPPLCLLP
jgi:hypothetical protein